MHVYYDFKKEGNELILGAVAYNNTTDFSPKHRSIVSVFYDGANQYEMCLMAFDNATELVSTLGLSGPIHFYNQNSGVVNWICNSDTCKQETYQIMIEGSLDRLRNMINVRPMIRTLDKAKDNKAKKFCIKERAEKRQQDKGFQDIQLTPARQQKNNNDGYQDIGGFGNANSYQKPAPKPKQNSNKYINNYNNNNNKTNNSNNKSNNNSNSHTNNNNKYNQPKQNHNEPKKDTRSQSQIDYDNKYAANVYIEDAEELPKTASDNFSDNVTNLLPFRKGM